MDASPHKARTELLSRIGRDLAGRFAGTFSRETVESYVVDCYDLLTPRATIFDYVPVLAGRLAADRLDALVRTEGLIAADEPHVLFVCTENAGRSQLAAALLRATATIPLRIHSAGTLPASDLDLVTQELLEERHLPADGAFPKPLTTEIVRAADVVVTLGCGDAAPIVAGRRYLDWTVPDLKGLDIETARSVCDRLDLRVRRLAASLAVGAHARNVGHAD